MPDSNQTLRAVNSDNQKVLHDMVKHIFGQSGIKRVKPLDTIHEYYGNSEPSVFVELGDKHDKKRGLYAATYLHHLMPKSPGHVSFFAGHGQDLLHSIRLQGEANEISDLLDQHGIQQRHLIPLNNSDKPEFRVFVYDEGGALKPNLEQLAKSVNGQVYVKKGTGIFVGGKDNKEANEARRRLIDKMNSQDSEMLSQIASSSNPKQQYARFFGDQSQKETKPMKQKSKYIRGYDPENDSLISDFISHIGEWRSTGFEKYHVINQRDQLPYFADALMEAGYPYHDLIRHGVPMSKDSDLYRPEDFYSGGYGFDIKDKNLNTGLYHSVSLVPYFQGGTNGFYFYINHKHPDRSLRFRNSGFVPHQVVQSLLDNNHGMLNLEQNGKPISHEKASSIVNHVGSLDNQQELSPEGLSAMENLTSELRKKSSRRGKKRKFAQFSADPKQSLNINVPLPQAVGGKQQAQGQLSFSPQAGEEQAPSSAQAMQQQNPAQQSVFKEMNFGPSAFAFPHYKES